MLKEVDSLEVFSLWGIGGVRVIKVESHTCAGVIIVNFVGSFCSSILNASMGAIIRDDGGRLLFAMMDVGIIQSSLIAKCLAASPSFGVNQIFLEGDSLEVISFLKFSLNRCLWTAKCIISNCKLLVMPYKDIIPFKTSFYQKKEK